jgi:hypothetical protein
MAPRFEKITTPHQQNQVLAQAEPNLLFKSGQRLPAVTATAFSLADAMRLKP